MSGEKSEGCFLCEKAKDKEESDPDNLLLHRGEHGFVILNLYPYNTGHIMIAPYLHVGDLTVLTRDASAGIWETARKAVSILSDEYKPHGYNIGLNLGLAAGAGLAEHLHLHVVPRWLGDTNYMPITAATKLLPEALEQTYARLRPLFDQLRPGRERA